MEKVAITGNTRGIGLGMAIEFLQAGLSRCPAEVKHYRMQPALHWSQFKHL